MPIDPGNLTEEAADYTEFAGSMAARIEHELNELLALDDLPPLPNGDDRETRDRRRLLVAIARGIVLHLNDRRASITIEQADGGITNPEFDIE